VNVALSFARGSGIAPVGSFVGRLADDARRIAGAGAQVLIGDPQSLAPPGEWFRRASIGFLRRRVGRVCTADVCPGLVGFP